jgi:hypothetical protein
MHSGPQLSTELSSGVGRSVTQAAVACWMSTPPRCSSRRSGARSRPQQFSVLAYPVVVGAQSQCGDDVAEVIDVVGADGYPAHRR